VRALDVNLDAGEDVAEAERDVPYLAAANSASICASQASLEIGFNG